VNRQQRRAKAAVSQPAPLLSMRLEAALGAEAPRSSLRPLAWQSAMRKLLVREAKREAL
jgi:hypothetical protein